MGTANSLSAVLILRVLLVTAVFAAGCASLAKNKPLKGVIAVSSVALGGASIGLSTKAGESGSLAAGSIVLGILGSLTGLLPMFAPDPETGWGWTEWVGLIGSLSSDIGVISSIGQIGDGSGDGGPNCTVGCRCGNTCISFN